jgi:hypothetical protein
MTASLTGEGSASHFPVSVIMERKRITDNPWIGETWKALGVTVGRAAAACGDPIPLVQGQDAAQYLWTGLRVDFFPDEAESYYHNLTVESPRCYVVARVRDNGVPEPVLVTASFDAAQAYHEGGDTVYSVPLPPEIYRAAEAFVLAHYVPEQKKKRPLANWKEDPHGGH